MRAALRSIMSLDVDDLESWAPQNDSWQLGVRLLVGPDDGPGEESFDLTVCNVAWLAERARKDGAVDGRHHLIVEHYDWRAVRSYVERAIRQCEGPTWDDVAEQVARLGYWEFEDYRPGTRGCDARI